MKMKMKNILGIQLFEKIFGPGKAVESDAIEIKFHRDANGLHEHGVIYANHVGQSLKNHPVRFAFVNLEVIPRLDRHMFNMICDKAEEQGYTVLGLRSFGQMRWMPSPVTPEQAKAAFANQNIPPHPKALQPSRKSA
jgi:hypothetical protein